MAPNRGSILRLACTMQYSVNFEKEAFGKRLMIGWIQVISDQSIK